MRERGDAGRRSDGLLLEVLRLFAVTKQVRGATRLQR